MKSSGAMVSRISTWPPATSSSSARAAASVGHLVHQQLDDHDDPLQPLDHLQHLLLVDARLLQENEADGVDLEDDLLEPELVGLVGDDEEMLVMYLRACNRQSGVRWMEAV